RNTLVEQQVARLVAQRVDVRAAVLHHRQHARRARTRTVSLRTVGVAVTAMKRVEVSRLVRGVNRHAGEARLLEIENLRALHDVPQGCGIHGHDYGRGTAQEPAASWCPPSGGPSAWSG